MLISLLIYDEIWRICVFEKCEGWVMKCHGICPYQEGIFWPMLKPLLTMIHMKCRHPITDG